MIRQKDKGPNGERAFGHFSFEGIVDSCNIDFFGQDRLTLVGDQGEKEFPARLLETPIVHVEVLRTRRLAQPTMLQYKDLALNGSNIYVAVHVELIVVLPDLDNPVGSAKSSVPNIHFATVFIE
jgi:hypothetical protein